MAAALKSMALVPQPADGPLAAAGLVTAILKHCSARSLDELYAAIRADDPKTIAKLGCLVISEFQLELIESHGDVVAHLRTGPTTNILLCNICGKTTVVAGAAPKKCELTLGCNGNPEKSGIAKKEAFVAE
jgi:hypothetical protein